MRCINPRCVAEFDWTFRIENFRPKFLAREYVDHTIELFMNRREADIVATRNAAVIRDTYTRVCRELYTLRNTKLAHPDRQEELDTEISAKMEHYRRARRNLRDLLASDQETLEAHISEPRRIVNCQKEGCRGIYDRTWTCTLCFSEGCEICNEAKDPGHTCNPDIIASIDIVRNEAKPCPKCGVSIMKSEGCDHMFCTHCKTAFSWNTGEIQTWSTNPLWYRHRDELRAQAEARRARAPEVVSEYAEILQYLQDELIYVEDVDRRDREIEFVVSDYALGKIDRDIYRQHVRNYIDDTRVRELRRYVINELVREIRAGKKPKKLNLKLMNWYLQRTKYQIIYEDDALSFELR